MRVIIGGKYQASLEASSVQIVRQVSDPVSTCTLSLQDLTSSIQITEMQEVLVLDDQAVPNPTVQFLQNPTLNPYTSGWAAFPATNLTFSANGGGGVIVTAANAANAAISTLSQTTAQGLGIVAGQSYMLSAYFLATAKVAIKATLDLVFQDANGVNLGNEQFNTFAVTNGQNLRFSVSGTAPVGTTQIQVLIGVITTSGTNSGTITITNVQLEPVWFPTIAYPTPFCAVGQPNCLAMPNSTVIRQSRKFGGLVTRITAGPYTGNVRTLTVSAVGYAWLLATHLYLTLAGFTSQTDAFIINNIVSNVWPGIFTQNHVQVGYTINQVGYNYLDIRTIFDGLAALPAFFWYIDNYYDIWYLPPGYQTAPFTLICDNSAVPDSITTFAAYDFLADTDFTQPCNQATVAGTISGATQAVRVLDPNSQAKYAINGQPSVFEHLINDPSLQSYNDLIQRGTAEILTYGGARKVYHLKTNVSIDPGVGVPVTSITDGLAATVLLAQKVTSTWLGTDETLKDVWEYSCDLGAYNPNIQSILRNINAKASASSSAIPVVNQIRLVVVEQIGMTESEAIH